MVDRVSQLEAMLEQEPGDAFCLYGLAMEYAKLGRHDEALSRFDDAITADPNQCYAYYHKARLLDDLGRVDDAAATVTEGLTQARSCGDAHAADELTALLDELS